MNVVQKRTKTTNRSTTMTHREHNEQYFEGLMRSLSQDQLNEIRQHFVDNDAEYVTFHVSVFNAGSTVSLTFTHDPEEFDPETYNGYDASISIDDVVTLIYKYDL